MKTLIEKIASPVVNDQILFLQGDRNYTYIKFLDGQQILCSHSLGKFEQLLCSNGFIRVHKSFIINHKYMESALKSSLLLKGYPLPVPVSRRRKLNLVKD